MTWSPNLVEVAFKTKGFFQHFVRVGSFPAKRGLFVLFSIWLFYAKPLTEQITTRLSRRPAWTFLTGDAECSTSGRRFEWRSEPHSSCSCSSPIKGWMDVIVARPASVMAAPSNGPDRLFWRSRIHGGHHRSEGDMAEQNRTEQNKLALTLYMS